MRDAFITIGILIFGGIFLAVIAVCIRLKNKIKDREGEVIKEKEESQRRIYELAILKEIGERAGYSLNIDEILRIITGSLRQFIDYSVAAYVVIEPEKFKLSTYLEQSVDKTFLLEMKKRMSASLSALLNRDISFDSFEESISGAVSLDIEREPEKIGSYFNIPLVISGKLAGLLTIAHVKEGLYKEEEMTILYKITAQASNAVTRLEEVVRIEEAKLMKVREEYTSMIVHELRSPLDGMKKIVELIISGSVDTSSSQFKEYINLLYQSASSTLELVNDILDYAKIQAGKFEIEKELADIKKIVNNRVSFYSPLAKTKDIQLNVLFDDNLPEKVLLDERAIKQVLNNFISNALKFTPKDGAVTIKVSLEADNIKVSVVDTGMGIPEEKINTLFTAYKQIGHNVDLENKGTGLGLVIVKGIIEAHKGTVGVVSKIGEGSTFFFTIPK